MRAILIVSALLAVAHASFAAPSSQDSKPAANGKYAEVNGLKMYYEIHGTGTPIVLLHGAFGFAEGWATILPALVKTRQVIVVEMQGHGRTPDRDKPLAYEQMADDVAELLNQLKIRDADFFGYSMGGTVGLSMAIRHPELVRKLAILGACSRSPKDVYEPEVYKQFLSMTPENFNFPQVKDPYMRLAPDPQKWPVLVSKIASLGRDFKGFPDKEVKSIRAHVIVMMGDRDAVRPEHAVELYRLIPNSQLAVLPGADHFMLFIGPDKVLSALIPFLEAPLPESK